jgi:ubiquinone/menaquinone biosynthesis C-methylase UbiE
VREYSLPPSDEPVDFRRQASDYARYRRDYSAALYDALAARTGPGAGRIAADVGCGTGFVASALRERGWRALGFDFSAPMLAAARRAAAGLPLVGARAEALPLRDASAALVACGTAFHWFAPSPAIAELERVLVPGGHVALFWRYPAPGQPYIALVGEMLRAAGAAVPQVFHGITVHPEAPFAGSGLDPEPPFTITGELAFTPESYLGYVATVEWVRRFAGARHAEFLDRLRTEVARRWPAGFRERNEEYVYLARKPRR